MTPFARLALLAGTTLYAFGLALIGVWLGWEIAAAVSIVGPGLAVIATIELAPALDASDDVAKPEVPGEPVRTPGLVTRARTDIERSARAARDEE